MIIATGVFEPTEENLSQWLKDAVTAAGIGSKLFPKEAINTGQLDIINALCEKSLAYIQKAKT